ncbi:preprotein translocase subunit SecE [Brevundimonas balnearis]|uniref:Protein translocase subunit SecE n=1 Tax=Brevundimonas balnearis TaxID=1572858 RepID=A0ABV6R413_9CAUL
MAKAKTPGGRRPGSPQPAQGPTVSVDQPTAKPRVTPMQFASQVRAEGRKIVWPSRKETWITSVMVFIMVALAAAFFWIVDALLTVVSQWIIGFGA